MLMNALEAAMVAVGYEVLNLKKREIDIHSIRSGTAMAIYLGDGPVFTIMMIGRGVNNTFL